MRSNGLGFALFKGTRQALADGVAQVAHLGGWFKTRKWLQHRVL